MHLSYSTKIIHLSEAVERYTYQAYITSDSFQFEVNVVGAVRRAKLYVFT